MYPFHHQRITIFFVVFLCFINSIFAQVIVPFNPRTSIYTPHKQVFNLQGDYTIIGNTNQTLSPYADNQNNATGTKGIFVDVDDDPYTFNSSSARLNFSGENGATNNCSQIVYAGLYWIGRAHVSGSSSPNTFNLQKYIPSTNPSAPNTSLISDAFAYQNTFHGQNISQSDYTLYIERQGSDNNYYVRYIFSSSDPAKPTVWFEHRNAGQATTPVWGGSSIQYVRYSTNNGGTWIYPAGQSSTTASRTTNTCTNINGYRSYRQTTFNDVTIYENALGEKLMVNTLIRDSRTNLPLSSYQLGICAYNANDYIESLAYLNRAAAAGNYQNLYTSYTKTMDKSVVYMKHASDTAYQKISALDNGFTNNIFYPDGSPTNSTADNAFSIFAGYAEVTDYVRQFGIGDYFVADIALTESDNDGTGHIGGWGLVVIYENALMKWRDIVIFDGYAFVSGSNASYIIDVNGINTVQNGEVDVKFGLIAGEGDVAINGEYFDIATQQNALPTNTFRRLNRDGSLLVGNTTNFFKSEISPDPNIGSAASRNPNLVNNSGMDIALFQLNNSNNQFITNGQSATRFRYGTTQDAYSIICMVLGVDAYVPEPEVISSINSINNSTVGIYDPYGDTGPVLNSYSVQPGDTISYKITIKNLIGEELDSLKITVPIPFLAKYMQLRDLQYYTINPNTQHSYLSFNPGKGASGTLTWYVGDLIPRSDVNDAHQGVIAELTYSIILTKDCDLLQSSVGCQPVVSDNAYTNGYGHISHVHFEGKELIYGLREAPCFGEPIKEKPIVNINVAAVCTNPPSSDTREIKLCLPDGITVPYSVLSDNFPLGTMFYKEINTSTGKPYDDGRAVVEYTAISGIPYSGISSNSIIYAVPADPKTTCYWKIKIVDLPDPAITTSNHAICGNQSLNLFNYINIPPNEVDNFIFHFYTDAEGIYACDSIVKPTETHTYYAMVERRNSQCYSNLSPILVTITPNAAINDTSITICSGATFTLNPSSLASNFVPANTTYQWELQTPVPSDITGASSQTITASAITQTLANNSNTVQTVHYKVFPATNTSGNICYGDTFNLFVNVNPYPADVVPSTISICYGDTLHLRKLLPSGHEYHFYATSNASDTLSTAIFPDFTNDGILYYVTQVEGNCESANRAALTITVETLPTITSVSSSQTVCSEESITISAVSAANINWYDAAVDGNFLSSLSNYTFTTPYNTSPILQTIYAEAVSTSTLACKSIRIPATYTVRPHAKPSNIITYNQRICSGDIAVIIANPSGLALASFKWYDENGNLIANTKNLTTGSLTNLSSSNTKDTTFYVSISNPSFCENKPLERKAVTISINKIPQIIITPNEDTVCQQTPVILNVTTLGMDENPLYFAWYLNDATTPGNGLFSPTAEGNNISIPQTEYLVTEQERNNGNHVKIRLDAEFSVCGVAKDSINIVVKPFSTSSKVDLIIQPLTRQEICVDTFYRIQIKADNEGSIHNLAVDFDDANNSLIGVGNAVYRLYNPDGSLQNTAYALTEIYRANPTVSSDATWSFPNDFILKSGDSVCVDIPVKAQCGFYGGNRYHINISANCECNEVNLPTQTVETAPFSTIHDIDEDSVKYLISSTFTPLHETTPITQINVNTNDTITWRCMYVIDAISSYETNLEIISFLVPKGIRLLKSTYNPVKNANILGNEFSGNKGIAYTFNVPALLKDNDTIIWEAQCVFDSASCGNYTFSTDVLFSHSASCENSPCVLSLLLGNQSLTLNIQRYQASMNKVHFSSLNNGNLRREYTINALTDFYTDDTLEIEVFIDQDNNDVFSAADVKISDTNVATANVLAGGTFNIPANADGIADRLPLIVHVSSPKLCESLDFPAATIFGQQVVCQGDTSIYYMPENKRGYAVVVPTAATRIPLQGRNGYTALEDSVRIVWNLSGNYELSGSYQVNFGGNANYQLFPQKLPVVVNERPVLDYVADSIIHICQGNSISILSYVRNLTSSAALIYTIKEKSTNTILPNDTVSPTASTTYSITAICDEGCKTPKALNLTVLVDKPVVINATIEEQADCGLNNGIVYLNLSGGSGKYLYSASKSGIYSKLEYDAVSGLYWVGSLAPGHYTFFVKDSASNCCSVDSTSQLIITAKSAGIMALDKNIISPPHCGANDGAIQLLMNGGSGTYEYNFDGTNNYIRLPADGIIRNLAADNYLVHIRDTAAAANCPAVELTPPIDLLNEMSNLIVDAISVLSQPTCNEAIGSIKLSLRGGSGNYLYQLNGNGNYLKLPNNQIITNLPIGNYYINVLDSNYLACPPSSSANISLDASNSDLFISTTVTSTNGCGTNNGEINIFASEGTAPYLFKGGSITDWTIMPDGYMLLNSLAAENYVLGVMDYLGCETYVNVEVQTINGLLLTKTTIPAVDCSTAGETQLTISGGSGSYEYQLNYSNWIPISGNTVIITTPAASNYLRIKDDAGCQISDIISNTLSNGNHVELRNITPASCSGEGGGSLSFHFTGSESPTYYIIGRDTVNISSTPDYTIFNLSAGMYHVCFHYADGCFIEYNNLLLESRKQSNLSIQSAYIVSQPECGLEGATGYAHIDVVGGSGNYVYSVVGDASNAFTLTDTIPVGKGSHRIYVWDEDDKNCPPAVSYLIEFTPKSNSMQVNLTVTPTTSCGGNDGSIQFDVSGAHGSLQYSFDGSSYTDVVSNIISPVSSGEHILKIRDDYYEGCEVNRTAVVTTLQSDYNLILTEVQAADCQHNGILKIKIEPYNYGDHWQYRVVGYNRLPMIFDTIYNSIPAGLHTVYAYKGNDCILQSQINISNGSSLTASLINVSEADCHNNGNITVNINGGNRPYRVIVGGMIDTTISSAGNITLSHLPVGIYRVDISDVNGCSTSLERLEIRRFANVVYAANDYRVNYKGMYSAGYVINNDYGDHFTNLTMDEILNPNDIISNIFIHDITGVYAYYPLKTNPVTAFLGSDSIHYLISNECGVQADAWLIIKTIDTSDTAPIAMPDLYTVRRGNSVYMPVIQNDRDPKRHPLSEPVLISSVNHGTLNYHSSDSSFTYTPDADFLGPDYFSYQICNNLGQCVTMTVTIVVFADVLPDLMLQTDDQYIMYQEDTLRIPASLGLLQNDLYTGTSATAYSIDWDLTAGDITINPDGSFTYIPAKDFYGEDMIPVAVCTDVSGKTFCDTGWLYILVIPEKKITCMKAVYSFTQPTDTVVTLPYGEEIYHFGHIGHVRIVMQNFPQDADTSIYIFREPSGFDFPAGKHEITWYAVNDCNDTIVRTQWLRVYYPPCGDGDTVWTSSTNFYIVDVLAIDADSNVYHSIRLGGECWTTRNLETIHCQNGDTIENHIYKSFMYPDTTANLTKYGRLYNYDAAMNACDTTDICPPGWKLPARAQWEKLIPYGSYDLSAINEWLLGNNATNNTSFMALPAGYYNYSTRTSYLLKGDCYFLSSEPETNGNSTIAHIRFICPVLEITDFDARNGVSVRCVKK